MKTIRPLPGNGKMIGKGADGEVYRISKGLVAKIFSGGENKKVGTRYANYEKGIAEELGKIGVNVPKMYGVYEIRIYDQLKTALIMEYIKGKNGKKLNYKENEKATKKLKQEIRKAKEKDYTSIDSRNKGNYILTPKGEVVLIDFTDWRRT